MKLRLIGRPIAINDKMVAKGETFEIDEALGRKLLEDSSRFEAVEAERKKEIQKGE